MLKKGRPIKFRKPGSIMERVYRAVADGHTAKMRIVVATSLSYQTVSTALYALTYCGNLVSVKEGRTFRYRLPETKPEITTKNIIELQRIFYAGTTEEHYSYPEKRETTEA
jgi:hypothetical protein